MRVLVTNNQFTEFAGTESWCRTVVDTLDQMGHEAHVWTLNPGEALEPIEAHVVSAPLPSYDLCLCNHWPTLTAIKDFVKGPKVLTCHGPYHKLEAPHKGADFIVAVSEEVRDSVVKRGFQEPIILRQPIDPQRFVPRDHSGKDVLILCKGNVGRAMAADACEALGLNYEIAHFGFRPVRDVEGPMRDSDIVISYGRGAYEGLACGCAVLVFDCRNGSMADGWVTADNVDQLARCNFSGRTHRLPYTDEDIARELLSYQPQAWSPEWVKREANAEAIVSRYLEFAH